MNSGLSIFLRKVHISLAVLRFSVRNKMLGFENANAFLHRLDKNATIAILKKNGAKIGQNCDIEGFLLFHNCTGFSNLTIGENCHVGKNCFFDLRDKIVIDKNVVISMKCSFITHLDLNKSELSSTYPSSHSPIYIKKNTYIGANSTILPGVVLAESCFIAAGSVITENIEPFTMAGGVPARTIRDLSLNK